MSNIDVAAIAARLAAITGGRWTAYNHACAPGFVKTDETFDNPIYDRIIANNMSHDDATFLAFAPSDIAALLFEVERLRAYRDTHHYPDSAADALHVEHS